MRRIVVTGVLACMSAGHTQALQGFDRIGSSLLVPTVNCSDLLSFPIANTEISSATSVAANGPMPAHCRVVGVTHGEPGSNVTVEVRMPDVWNNKLLMTTRQAYMGSISAITNP